METKEEIIEEETNDETKDEETIEPHQMFESLPLVAELVAVICGGADGGDGAGGGRGQGPEKQGGRGGALPTKMLFLQGVFPLGLFPPGSSFRAGLYFSGGRL